jgi:hypothetical protein
VIWETSKSKQNLGKNDRMGVHSTERFYKAE